MQSQQNKKRDQQKMDARIALGGEKINDVSKNKEVERKKSVEPQKNEYPVISKKSFTKKEVKINNIQKEQKITTQTTAISHKDTHHTDFLNKIRPKNKIAHIPEKKPHKIERVQSQKNSNNRNYKIQTIRTYSSDIADVVKKEGESLTQIAIKENRKKIKEKKHINKTTEIYKKESRSTKNILLVVGILVIVISVTLLTYKFIKKGFQTDIFKKTITKIDNNLSYTPTATSLIQANTEKRINISENKENTLKIIYNEFKKIQSTGNIENIYLYKIINTVVDNKKKQEKGTGTTQDFISLWKNNMSDPLIRSFGKKFMLGIYSTKEGINTPFIILSTSSYAQTFAGMIGWEQTMYSDFDKLFNIKLEKVNNKSFKDEVIDGENARILTDSSGNILIIYSFINKKIIIITTDKKTFSKLLQKIKK